MIQVATSKPCPHSLPGLAQLSYNSNKPVSETARVEYSPYGSIIEQSGSLPTDRLVSVSDWDGFLTTYSYDAANQLSITGAHAAPVASYAYSYDAVGNRIQAVEWVLAPIVLPVGTYLEENGQVVLEAENGQRANGHSQNWLPKTSLPDYTGTSYLQSSLDIDALVQTNEITASPKVEYPVNFTSAATYTVWMRGYAPNAAGDSVYVGVGDNEIEVTGFAPRQWDWANLQIANGELANMQIEQAGTYTVSLWMREDGLRIVRLLLTTDTTYTRPALVRPKPSNTGRARPCQQPR